MRRSLASVVLGLAACSSASSNSSGVEDWTARRTQHYEGTAKGVTFALDLAEGREGKAGDPRSKADWWFVHPRGESPTVSITILPWGRSLDDDLEYSRLKRNGAITSSQVFENGYTFTYVTRDTDYHSVLVMNLTVDSSIACEAVAGDSPPDPRITAKLPALEAICRTLDVGGMRPKVDPPTAVAPPMSLPSECTAYLARMTRLAACDKLSDDQRAGLKLAADGAGAAWARTPPRRRARLVEQCAAGARRLDDDAAACGL